MSNYRGPHNLPNSLHEYLAFILLHIQANNESLLLNSHSKEDMYMKI